MNTAYAVNLEGNRGKLMRINGHSGADDYDSKKEGSNFSYVSVIFEHQVKHQV